MVTGQCNNCGQSDGLTTALISLVPFSDCDRFDPNSLALLCRACYREVCDTGLHVREFPIRAYWTGAEFNDDYGLDDRRVTMYPPRIREWMSYPDWLEVDLADCE